MRARDESTLAMENAWKGGLAPGDVINFGGKTMVVDSGPATGRPVLRDASKVDGDERKQAAYSDGVRDMTDAWAKKPPKREEEEREEDPDKHEWEMAGPLSDGQSVKDAARAEYEADLVDAWRR
jgi:hypothetical protein